MIVLIDSIFNPLINWLMEIQGYLNHLSVPLSKPILIENYLGYLVLLGSGWVSFISTVCTLAFCYGVIFIIMASQGMVIKFKDTVKWW